MKITTIITLAVLLTVVSCKKDSEGPTTVLRDTRGLTQLEEGPEITYEESLAAWADLKKVNGDSYVYSIWQNYDIGTELHNWSETFIYVEEGIVTYRVYNRYLSNTSTFELYLVSTWTETQANLGSHDEGALPKTIDELYLTCARDYLVVDPANNTILFSTAENGLYHTCGYLPSGCPDCYPVVTISLFGWSN